MFFSSLTIMSWLPLGKNLNCPSQPPTPDTHNKQTNTLTDFVQYKDVTNAELEEAVSYSVFLQQYGKVKAWNGELCIVII